MKAKHVLWVYFALCPILLGSPVWVLAQDKAPYITISGTVKDAKSKKNLEHVNVSAVGTNIGTVTNQDGEFTLKVDRLVPVKEIKLSSIGYFNARFTISPNDTKDQTYLITSQSFQLSEVEVFSWKNPRDLVEAALEKVDPNYSMQPNLMTAFYRETIQKRRKYIDISEAVIHLYKTAYNQGITHDRTQVLKGRKLVSQRRSDTLSVKFLGGPNLGIYLDVVKNPDLLLEPEILRYYAYKMGETTTINDRLHYVVHFEPQVSLIDNALYTGTFYIDRESLSFSRIEFSMDMSDKQKVAHAILKVKPAGLRFTPEQVSYAVNYKLLNGKTYLSYLRSEINFKCDWKKRLFATSYSVIAETVITDNREENAPRILARDAFSMNKSLSQEVGAYHDDDFWGSYNIIEPTESLENAVGRLRKQQQNQ